MKAGHRQELRVDSLLAVILALVPFGYENLDIPHSRTVGLMCWGVCLILLVRIIWITWILFASAANVTFKNASAFTWWRRQVIKYDISGMHTYFMSLDIPIPDKIPPVTVNEENPTITNSPHLYRSELSIPRLKITDRREVTHIYAVYIMEMAFPDITKSPDFWKDLPKNLPRLSLRMFFSIELRKYLHASYWNSINPNSPPGALLLWKIREILGRKLTDSLVSKVYRVAADSLSEIFDPDVNVALTKALKIADEIVEAYQQSWPKIQQILNENRIEVQSNFTLINPVSGPPNE